MATKAEIELVTAALPSWYAAAVQRAAVLSLGPSSVPLALRKVPLWVLARYVAFVARRVL